jgi:bacillithiol synthase
MVESMQVQDKKFYYNSLFNDYIFSYKKLKKYFHYDFHNPGSFKKRAEHVSATYDNSLRARISDRLVYINKSFGCNTAVIKNCESLKDPDTMVVIGGQQPGLFTGPVFIIYKIFSIIKLAGYLSDFLNLKVIPVFWNASDDSNLSQVNNTFLLDKELREVVLNLSDTNRISGLQREDTASKRFSDIIIAESLAEKKINEFLGFLPKTDFKDDIEVFFKDCLERLPKCDFNNSNPKYSDQPKAGFPTDPVCLNSSGHKNNFRLNDLFSALITGLFSKYGLVLIDPSDIELKKLSLPVLEKDIINHTSIEKSVNKSGEKLFKEGYHSQLSTNKDFLNFFIVKDGVRQRVKCGKNSFFIIDKKALSAEDLKSLIVSDFSKISLNVISRPLFQDMALPVLATICGPGEVSYFSQLKDVYDIFGLKQPVIYPRFSATIVEIKVKKAIEKAGAGIEILNHEIKDAVSIALKSNIGIDVAGTLKSLEDDIMVKTGKVESLVESYGIGCAGYFDRFEDNLKKEIKTLNKKISSEVENKNLFLVSNIDKIYLNLFPKGLLQERVLNIFQYINKYDFKLLDDLYNIIDSENHFHKLIFL